MKSDQDQNEAFSKLHRVIKENIADWFFATVKVNL